MASPAIQELTDSLPDGTVIVDADVAAAYSRDRTDVLAAGAPLAVVSARSTDDVARAMAWAHAHDVPVVTRGAGTGLSGGATATPGCLVLSLAKMNRILSIEPDDFVARVEAGVINGDLDRAAKPHGLMYAPDPSSMDISTIGGNIATNAGGLRCVKYGVTRNSVRSLTVVLADGRVLRTGHDTVKGVSGLDMVGLFCGSEGTLGVITEATVALVPRPAGDPVTLLAPFPTADAALGAVSAAMRLGADPELMEFMDRRTLQSIDDWKGTDFASSGGMVLSQVTGPDAAARAELIAEAFRAGGADDVAVSANPAEGEQLIAIRRLAYPAKERLGHALTEDVCVPRSRLAHMMRFIDRLAAEKDLTICTVAHAGDGNLHPVFIYDGATPADVPGVVWESAGEIFREALRVGGTLTGEHGVGTLKRRFLAEELGDVGVDVQRAIKAALDPKGLLNPSKALA
ncbi:MAG TPA: FAD-binding protein [Corynebacterium xerosis]|uniref:FAD-binding oxidoreductase n=1 Tax=Corynebacterium xerosis TaxID=1725 RepID=UPI001DAABAC1|nr:FAD-linked oxidase C-terminal domain-containing protein [Corynebacterium xerosis]HJG57348.1 FAD-binding protein [Corynebacterium xerosis]